MFQLHMQDAPYQSIFSLAKTILATVLAKETTMDHGLTLRKKNEDSSSCGKKVHLKY